MFSGLTIHTYTIEHWWLVSAEQRFFLTQSSPMGEILPHDNRKCHLIIPRRYVIIGMAVYLLLTKIQNILRTNINQLKQSNWSSSEMRSQNVSCVIVFVACIHRPKSRTSPVIGTELTESNRLSVQLRQMQVTNTNLFFTSVY